jgi:hypothetical protein
MKHFGMFFLVLALAIGVGGLGAAQATDITIWDYQNHSDFSPNPPGSPTIPPLIYNKTPTYENQSVTLGAINNQTWDMEKFEFTGTISAPTLTMTGGFDWKNGNNTTGRLWNSGDLFIDTTVLNAPFGRFIPASPSPPPTGNDFWKYNYVVDFGRNTNGSLGGNYTIFKVPDISTVVFSNVSQIPSDSPADARQYSNPYMYVSGGTSIATGSFTQTTTTDSEGNHYSIPINLKPIIDDLGITELDEFIFRSHITMGCGNDTLVGQQGGPPGVVPLPGALLLLGSGMIRLVSYGRKHLSSQT